MVSKRVVLLAIAFLLTHPASGQVVPDGEQTPPAQPPPAPGQSRSTEDIVRVVEQRLAEARELKALGRMEPARVLLLDAQHGLEMVLTAAGANVNVQVLAAEVEEELGNLNDARMMYKEVLKTEDGNFRANLGLGRFYAGSRMWRQAMGYLEKAERVAPTDRHAEALRLLAICYNGQGRQAEAVSAAQRAVAADPQEFESQQFLVHVRLDAGQYEQAVQDAKTLRQTMAALREQDPSGLVTLQQTMAAADLLQRALTYYHNDFYLRDARGEPTDELAPGNEHAAAEVLRQLSQVAEEMAALRKELSYHDRLVFIEKAVIYQPNDTGYLLELASLNHAIHREDEAIDACQRILAITRPTDTDPAKAEQNTQTAREFLIEQGAPLTKEEVEAAEEPVAAEPPPAPASQPTTQAAPAP